MGLRQLDGRQHRAADINLAVGHWHQTSRHVSPLVGFACGILAARLLQLMTPRWVRQPTIAALMFEIVFLTAADLAVSQVRAK
jgi:uncharacterized membrane protein YoaK (UPF0700 family)